MGEDRLLLMPATAHLMQPYASASTRSTVWPWRLFLSARRSWQPAASVGRTSLSRLIWVAVSFGSIGNRVKAATNCSLTSFAELSFLSFTLKFRFLLFCLYIYLLASSPFFQAQAWCILVLCNGSCAAVISLRCKFSEATFPSQEFSHPHAARSLCCFGLFSVFILAPVAVYNCCWVTQKLYRNNFRAFPNKCLVESAVHLWTGSYGDSNWHVWAGKTAEQIKPLSSHHLKSSELRVLSLA